jgi:uncharacterized protein
MELIDHWGEIRSLFNKSLKTAKHLSFATVDKDGNPHVTPIGSLILKNDCTGYFSDKFPKRMKDNFQHSDRVAIMAINTGFWFWFKSIRKGKFVTLPGVRLYGRVGEKRKATEKEQQTWLKQVKFAKGTKGYNLLWKDMSYVRDIHFDSFRPVLAGEMTSWFGK